jgi:hypothetical protein
MSGLASTDRPNDERNDDGADGKARLRARLAPSPYPRDATRHDVLSSCRRMLPAAGRPAVTSSRYCDDVLDRMHDPFDLGCQRLEGVAHLLDVLVAIVDAADAADGMA